MHPLESITDECIDRRTWENIGHLCPHLHPLLQRCCGWGLWGHSPLPVIKFCPCAQIILSSFFQTSPPCDIEAQELHRKEKSLWRTLFWYLSKGWIMRRRTMWEGRPSCVWLVNLFLSRAGKKIWTSFTRKLVSRWNSENLDLESDAEEVLFHLILGQDVWRVFKTSQGPTDVFNLQVRHANLRCPTVVSRCLAMADSFKVEEKDRGAFLDFCNQHAEPSTRRRWLSLQMIKTTSGQINLGLSFANLNDWCWKIFQWL